MSIKSFIYKVYLAATGGFFATPSDVNMGSFSKTMNGGLGELVLGLARTFEAYGEGTDVDYLNEWRVVLFDDKVGDAGKRVYAGYVSAFNPIWEENTGSKVEMTLLGYATDLTSDIVEQSAREVVIPRSAEKTSDNMKYLIDLYRASRSQKGEENDTGATNEDLGGATWVAQSFQVAAGQTEIAKVAVRMKYNAGSGDTITCRIETDVAGDPSGNLVDANATVTTQNDLADTDADYIEFVFPISFTISVATTYWIVLTSAGSGATTVYHVIRSASSEYGDGTLQYSTDSGANWNDRSADARFRTYYIDENFVKLNYTGDSIEDSGDSITYTFAGMNYRNAFNKNLELAHTADRSWYWYIDENHVVFFKKSPTTATHTFVVRKDVKKIVVHKSVEKLRNKILLWNSQTGGGQIFAYYKDDDSIVTYRRRTALQTDSRIGTTTEADAVGNRFLVLNKDPSIRTVLTLSSDTFDLTTINPGETCKIRGLDTESQETFSDNMVIRKITYRDNMTVADLEVEDLQPEVSDAVRNLEREVLGLQNASLPTEYELT